MKIKKRISTLFCAMAIVLWCMAGVFVHVSAEETTGALSVWCTKDDTILEGMHWKIYRVGHREQDSYVFEGDFAGHPITLGDQKVSMLEWDVQKVKRAANTLRMYANTRKIPNRGEGYTDEKGMLTFEGLEDGLYLVCGDELKIGQYTYIPSNIFFEMHGEEEAYLNAFPKIILNTLDKLETSYTVKKEWENDAYQEWNRSVYITVQRYCDGDPYGEPVKLSEENDWTYTWSYAVGHEWNVEELDIPPYYTVSYDENVTKYYIVNTLDKTDDSSFTDRMTTTKLETTTMDNDRDVHTTATSGDELHQTNTTATTNDEFHGSHTTAVSMSNDEGSSTTMTNDTDTKFSTDGQETRTTVENKFDSSTTMTETVTSVTTTVPPGTSDKSSGKLPQTGQLWWPVPPLAFGGIVLLSAGIRLGKKEDEE